MTARGARPVARRRAPGIRSPEDARHLEERKSAHDGDLPSATACKDDLDTEFALLKQEMENEP